MAGAANGAPFARLITEYARVRDAVARAAIGSFSDAPCPRACVLAHLVLNLRYSDSAGPAHGGGMRYPSESRRSAALRSALKPVHPQLLDRKATCTSARPVRGETRDLCLPARRGDWLARAHAVGSIPTCRFRVPAHEGQYGIRKQQTLPIKQLVAGGGRAWEGAAVARTARMAARAARPLVASLAGGRRTTERHGAPERSRHEASAKVGTENVALWEQCDQNVAGKRHFSSLKSVASFLGRGASK